MESNLNISNAAAPQESILVCVSYGPSSERLIRRGWKLANVFQAPLTILTIDPQGDSRYDETKEKNMAMWQSLANNLEAEFIVSQSRSRSVAQAIVDVAREKKITQIVLGQSAQTRWEELSKGSIINGILKLIELVDIHVVSVEREVHIHEEDYGQGVKAYLVKEDDTLRLQFDNPPPHAIEGVFYQSVYSDFNNGVFKMTENQKTTKYRIFDGIVTNEIN